MCRADVKRKNIVFAAAAVCAALSLCAEQIGTNGLAGVELAGDAICTVSGSAAMSNGIAIVDYALRPETGSCIRCRISLPPPEKWNGERTTRASVTMTARSSG